MIGLAGVEARGIVYNRAYERLRPARIITNGTLKTESRDGWGLMSPLAKLVVMTTTKYDDRHLRLGLRSRKLTRKLRPRRKQRGR